MFALSPAGERANTRFAPTRDVSAVVFQVKCPSTPARKRTGEKSEALGLNAAWGLVNNIALNKKPLDLKIVM